MSGQTYLILDGENIDATLGTSVLGRSPRPTSDLDGTASATFAQRSGTSPSRRCSSSTPRQARCRCPSSRPWWRWTTDPSRCPGPADEKVVDIGIKRMLDGHPRARGRRAARQPRRRLPAGGKALLEARAAGGDPRPSASSSAPRWPSCPASSCWTSSTTPTPSPARSPGSGSSRSTSSTRWPSSDQDGSQGHPQSGRNSKCARCDTCRRWLPSDRRSRCLPRRWSR